MAFESNKQYDNTNRGGLWTNKRKEKDNHPDYTGNIVVECPCCKAKTDSWLSAWKKYAANTGEAFLSLSIKPKDEKPASGPAPSRNVDDFLGAPQAKIKTPLDDIDVDGDAPF